LSLPDEPTTDSAPAAHGSRLSAEEREALLRERVEALPTSPGVYRFRNARGRVLYVGKAQNLRARVRSYFGGGDGRLRVPKLVDRTTDVDVVVTESVKDALLLENELIKQHKPPFNVRLRDDKQYLVLRLDPSAGSPATAPSTSVPTRRASRCARPCRTCGASFRSARAATACFAITRGADGRASSTR
jgi:excinuclease ABC subunit C